MKYTDEEIDVKLKTMRGFYFLWMPVRVPYGKLAAQKKGKTEIWEKGKMIGSGWIGIEDKNGDKHIQGKFKSVIHTGPYKKLGQTYRKIMKDHKRSNEMYNIYINSPMDVSEGELKTKIIFR